MSSDGDDRIDGRPAGSWSASIWRSNYGPESQHSWLLEPQMAVIVYILGHMGTLAHGRVSSGHPPCGSAELLQFKKQCLVCGSSYIDVVQWV